MRIAVVSDTHLAPGAHAFLAGAERALDWVGLTRPDLVVHLGDVTADGVLAPVQFGYARDVLARLSAPAVFTPGNHDVGDTPPKGGHGEPALSIDALAAFRAAFGADRWSLRADGWLLIGVNAQLLDAGVQGTEAEREEVAQAAWLEALLADADRPIALFLHKPLFLETPDEAPDHPRYAPRAARARLLALFAGRDLRLVVSGHAHQSRQTEIAGVTHAWAPSTAFIIPDRLQPRLGEKRCGVLHIELTPGGAQVRSLTPEGMASPDLFDHADVYPQVAALRARR